MKTTVLTENEDTKELLKSNDKPTRCFQQVAKTPYAPDCRGWHSIWGTNSKNVFLDHAKISFQTWEKTARMLSVELHKPLTRSAHSHPSNTLHCIAWNSQSCHSKSLRADGRWAAPARQQRLWDWFRFEQTCDHITWTTTASVPARDQVASLNVNSMIRDLQRKHFLQPIRFAACKANFKRWAVPDASEKVCACSVIQGVWPRFSSTTKLMQHL